MVRENKLCVSKSSVEILQESVLSFMIGNVFFNSWDKGIESMIIVFKLSRKR